jgi:hypothetical protein
MSATNQQKEARRQRERDELLRRQEWEIAKRQNELQQKMAIDRYQDNLLVTYTKDMSDLLTENDGSLTFPV